MKNGLRRIVAGAVFSLSLAVVLYGAILSLATTTRFDGQDWIMLGIPTGLLGYSLRIILGVSPWRDIADGLRKAVGTSGQEDAPR